MPVPARDNVYVLKVIWGLQEDLVQVSQLSFVDSCMFGMDTNQGYVVIAVLEIICSKQFAPMNGTVEKCGNKMGDTCNFDCIDGYFIDRGTSSRTCQENGEWDGAQPHCSGM